MPLPDALLDLAARQHGVFDRRQAHDHAVDRHRLRTAREAGQVRSLSPMVFAVAGSPPTDQQAVMAAVLDDGPGSMASHHTALALFGLPGFELTPPHLLTPRRRTSRRTGLGVVHSTRWLRPNHSTELFGIPVSTPWRAIFDVAWFVHPLKLELTIDRAASRRLTTYALLHETFDDLARRGRPLTTLMRRLLEERPVDFIPPESGLESRFQQIMRDAGVTSLRRQVNVGSDTEWLGRVDFADEHLPVLVQIDSDAYHTALVDVRADRRQTEQMRASGFIVARIREFDVWHRRAVVVDQVKQAFRDARRAVA